MDYKTYSRWCSYYQESTKYIRANIVVFNFKRLRNNATDVAKSPANPGEGGLPFDCPFLSLLVPSLVTFKKR